MELSPEDRKTIGEDIATLEFCWPVGMPKCLPMRGFKGLYEIRSNISSGRIARILFVLIGNQMVLLHGFVKKTQKTPDKELKVAATRMKRCSAMNENPHIGESFDSFLRDEGIYDEVTATAIKRTLALQIEHEMVVQNISKSEMARRMKTSASQLARLLDPANDRIQLDTLVKAASAVGKSLAVGLV
ncbi:MAG: hypothetical protein JWL86_6677 [Rhizobium sp.]|nr:hypothetical protein [Rhizobium sp.]